MDAKRTPLGAGIGLRLQHLATVLAERPKIGWCEIHPENYLANPHALELLTDIARLYPISMHSVGVSVGSAGGLDRAHLRRIRTLADTLKPVLISGHLAWSTHDGDYLNDLLPLPYTAETVEIVSRHIDEVQQGLGRAYHLENPSNYLGFAESTMTETAFLRQIVWRTGCRLLCDVSNVHVSAHNLGYDARAYIDDFPAEAVGELHLGGFELEDEPGGTSVIVDTHAAPIDPAAWDLFAYAIRRFGPHPTLIEWDNAIPAIATLLAEADTADAILHRVQRETRHAAFG